MPSEIVQRVLDQIHLLTAEERGEVKALMDSVPRGPETRTEEDEIRRSLLREGVIITRRPPVTDYTPWDEWKPVEVQGKPVSETIIEERR